MKATYRIIYILVIILILFNITLLGIQLNIFQTNFYHDQFIKHGVSRDFPGVDLDSYNRNVLDYVSGKKEYMPVAVPLNNRELEHMSDVKSIYIIAKFTNGFTLIMLAILLFTARKIRLPLRKLLRYGGIVSLAFILLVVLLFTINFEFSFNLFHSLLFDEGSWFFSPNDNIIKIYPAGLFIALVTRILVMIIIISIALIISTLRINVSRSES